MYHLQGDKLREEGGAAVVWAYIDIGHHDRRVVGEQLGHAQWIGRTNSPSEELSRRRTSAGFHDVRIPLAPPGRRRRRSQGEERAGLEERHSSEAWSPEGMRRTLRAQPKRLVLTSVHFVLVPQPAHVPATNAKA
jgi:hypothetical protein